MYKTRLQELCQKWWWERPVYELSKEGPDHGVRYQAKVVVQGRSFSSRSGFTSSKEAQNDAAKVAVDYLSPSQQRENDESTSSRVDPVFKNLLQDLVRRKGYQLPVYATTVSGAVHLRTFVSTVKVGEESFTGQEARTKKQAELSAAKVAYTALQQRPSSIDMNRSPMAVGESQDPRNQIASNDDRCGESGHMYKNQLQIYAAKRNLGLPSYSWECLGPPHACSFKCRVTIDGKTYEREEFYTSIGKAEHAAAKVALMSLSPDRIEEDVSIYKNLLQQLVHRDGSPLPIYDTKRAVELRQPVFFSTVEVKGQVFRGLEARTKKQAEMNVAKIAYTSLKGQCEMSSRIPEMLSSVVQQEAILPSATSPCHPDLVNYLDQNFRLQLPEANENMKDRGTETGNNGELIASAGTDLNSIATGASTSSAASIHVLGQDLSLSYFPCEGETIVVEPSGGEGDVVTNESDLTKTVVVHPQEETQTVCPPDSTVLLTSNEDSAATGKASPQLNLNQ